MNFICSRRTDSALAFFFSWIFISTLCFAQGTTTKMNVSPENVNAPETSSPSFSEIRSRLTYPNDITVAKLANGLTVIVQENHTAPVATVRCAVRNTGSVNETKYLGAGLSHVLEHVVAGGSTTKRSEKEIRDLIDTFGGVTNAYTSLDVTSYFIDCPVRNVETCIELIADQMQHAAFIPSEFDRELEVVQRELADGEENRARVMWKLAQETLYQESPAHLPIIGYLDVLRQVKREQIIDFYRERYVPNNMVFVVCGDVQTDAVLNQVVREFAGTPRGFDANVFVKPEPAQNTTREAIREMDGSTTDILLAFPTVNLYSQDLFTLDLLSYILSEGDSSRMVRDMQYDQSLVLSVGTSSYTPTFARGYFGIRMSVLPQNEQKAIETALNHIYRLKTDLVSPAELAKAKKQKASELIFEHQTVQQQAESLASSYLATGSPMFDEAYVAGLQKVTAEQIRAAANKYFRPEVLTTIKIVPQGTLASQGKTGKAENASKQDVQQFILPNGLKVLVKRDTHLPMVDMKIYTLGGDLFDSEETAGRANFIASMLDKGTPTRTAEEITSWFDSVGGFVAFSSGRNTYSGGFSVMKEDYPRALEIVADCWQNAAFPKEKFDQVKTLLLGSIARRSENPQAELFETWADALPNTTPFHLVSGGKLETVSRMTPESLRAFYRENVLDPENSILTLYGDLDVAEAKALIAKYFGTMPKLATHKTVNFARSNALPENVKIHKVTGKETGMVLISFAAPPLKINEKELMAVRLLNAVMAGYGYPGGWLHEELRGEGLVYAVHCVTRSSMVPGYMIFIAQTSPDKVDEVVGRLFKNIEKAKAGQITPEELNIAKQKLCALHAQSDTTISEQAVQQGLNVLYGLGIDFDRGYDDRVNATTLEDVKAAARKFLGGNYVQVTTSNQEK
ncbi:MAG: insulinase family protein [Thermoguttaceae bacterium]|nr:insulinase family protein [Thermoguttaceae bacterium]